MSDRVNPYGQPIGAPVSGWAPRPRPERRTLTGRWCRLEPLEPARHGQGLFEAWAQAPDGRDWTYLFHERPADAGACAAYLHGLEHAADALHYAIVETDGGRPLGTLAVMRMQPDMGVIEVGHITYSLALKRTRAGTEAIFLLMQLVFDQLRYRRFEWKCDSLNAPSRAAAERYGFGFEGIFRQAVVYKGRNRDTAWYAITDADWPAIAASFRAWLEPGNFDPDGGQRATLRALRRR